MVAAQGDVGDVHIVAVALSSISTFFVCLCDYCVLLFLCYWESIHSTRLLNNVSTEDHGDALAVQSYHMFNARFHEYYDIDIESNRFASPVLNSTASMSLLPCSMKNRLLSWCPSAIRHQGVWDWSESAVSTLTCPSQWQNEQLKRTNKH